MTRNNSLTWQYGQKNVIFSRICRAIPQKFVAQKPLDYFAVQGKKETVGLLFLAGNMEVWPLKVAAAAAVAAAVEASIPGWWTLFWVTATPCLPEASLSSVTHPSLPPSLLPSIRPSTRASKTAHHVLVASPQTPFTRACVFVFKGGREGGVECFLNRYSAMYRVCVKVHSCMCLQCKVQP